MIISFFGHRDFCGSEAYEKRLLQIFENVIGEEAVEFYLGGYGGFDSFAYCCCNQYQKTHTHAKLIFVTPYFLQKNSREELIKYDEVIYPEIEHVPPKFAIIYRNRYMVDRSDVIISGVKYSRGGAYQACLYAKKKEKRIIALESEAASDTL